MKSFCYQNSKILPLHKAHISAQDIGILRGFGIYDGIKMYNSKPFRFNDHLKRFENSATTLSLKIPLSKNKILDAITSLSKKFKNKNPNIKLYLTGGPLINALQFNKNQCTFFIIAEEVTEISKEYIVNGCSLLTHEYQREYPRVKTINYITAVILQPEKKKRKALEILYVKDNKVLECSTSNLFIIKNDTVITPKDNILLGITRRTIIEISKRLKKKVEEREITFEEVLEADEVFITSSYKEVVPVIQIDSKRISNAKPGVLTRKLIEEFKNITKI